MLVIRISKVVFMPHDDIEIIGKNVKDMYGTFIGKVVGTLTDIDGSIQTVGVDCGSKGLEQIPYEQLVVQGEVVIYIPKWRLDSQRLLREKGLTLRRIKALMDIVKENDDMREDAEIIHEKYKSKLTSLEETETSIKTTLAARLDVLAEQTKASKTILFDAKVQFKSNEISESTFETVKKFCTALIEHCTHEQAEITNIQRRIADLDRESQATLIPPQKQLQESAVSYLTQEVPSGDVQTILPEAPTSDPVPSNEVKPSWENTENSSSPQTVESSTDSTDESDWLSRMEAQ